MPWLSASMTVPTDAVDSLCDALMAAGALSVDVSDADAGTEWERPIFDEPDGARAAEGIPAPMSAPFELGADVAGLMSQAFAQAAIPSTTAYEVTRLDDEDWVRKTQS